MITFGEEKKVITDFDKMIYYSDKINISSLKDTNIGDEIGFSSL